MLFLHRQIKDADGKFNYPKVFGNIYYVFIKNHSDPNAIFL